MYGSKVNGGNLEAVAGELTEQLMAEHGNAPGQTELPMEDIFKFSMMLTFFGEKIKKKVIYSVSDEFDWPLIDKANDMPKLTLDLKLSQFAALLVDGTQTSLKAIYPVKQALLK